MTRTLTPAPTEPGRSAVWTTLRLVGGCLLLAALAYLLWTPGAWSGKLLAWVLLTILADEFGGWFGYIGTLLGGLPLLAPGELAPQWPILLPLVGGALLALLLVKHAGGAFVLPFAGAVFALPLLALARYGTKLDPELTLPANETFWRTAMTGMIVGLALSFMRQLIGVAWRFRARRRAQRTPLTTGTALPPFPPEQAAEQQG